MPDGLRQRFERSLGKDLGHVRVHTDEASEMATEAVGAKAFAHGADIHFAKGQFSPGSEGGDQLIAHEVAHTVQTGGTTDAGPQFKLDVSQPGEPAEVEADAAADAMVKGAPASVSAQGAKIHRSPLSSAAAAPKAATPGFQQNEQVDHKKIAAMITSVNTLSEHIGDRASTTGDECQVLLTTLTAGGTGGVVGGMNKLADTFASAALNFEKELGAALKANAPAKAQIAAIVQNSSARRSRTSSNRSGSR
ncbi:MAG: DUF4157 domain-containing protein [Deltaproteobacteria bacterium]|nr:DUF4157 domain-containing protein [Deltaproteobacteria bacterium]MDQ3294973.1 DUF4157 domain-containing protein [Myxococcota bacterium]